MQRPEIGDSVLFLYNSIWLETTESQYTKLRLVIPNKKSNNIFQTNSKGIWFYLLFFFTYVHNLFILLRPSLSLTQCWAVWTRSWTLYTHRQRLMLKTRLMSGILLVCLNFSYLSSMVNNQCFKISHSSLLTLTSPHLNKIIFMFFMLLYLGHRNMWKNVSF